MDRMTPDGVYPNRSAAEEKLPAWMTCSKSLHFSVFMSITFAFFIKTIYIILLFSPYYFYRIIKARKK